MQLLILIECPSKELAIGLTEVFGTTYVKNPNCNLFQIIGTEEQYNTFQEILTGMVRALKPVSKWIENPESVDDDTNKFMENTVEFVKRQYDRCGNDLQL